MNWKNEWNSFTNNTLLFSSMTEDVQELTFNITVDILNVIVYNAIMREVESRSERCQLDDVPFYSACRESNISGSGPRFEQGNTIYDDGLYPIWRKV